MIEEERFQVLNNHSEQNGKYVLYWMQQSQRAEENHALEYACLKANSLSVPLLVVFGLTDNYPEANVRHYFFMLQGLKETQNQLRNRNIKLEVFKGNPPEVALKYSEDACLVVCDRGYLRHQKKWRKQVAESCSCRVVQVETDVVVPVNTTSDKKEFAARTIRRKVHLHLPDYTKEIKWDSLTHSSLGLPITGIDLTDLNIVCNDLKIDHSVTPVTCFFNGGTSEAKRRFNQFLEVSLQNYITNRNQPHTNDISHMSMYLNFGQISPLWLLLKVQERPEKEEVKTYVEELVVRRELSMNFVNFTDKYDQFEALPDWARQSLTKHSKDIRDEVYSLNQLEGCQTNDPYWNACMKEMKVTGFMHNYMRMYWGKKILEWTASPQEGFKHCLYLNNKYFLDGRGPVGFANVAWIFGLHDRPWKEISVFGKIRVMKASGLKRKFNPDLYVKKVDELEEIFLKSLNV